jgi:guanine deaminase
MSSNPNPAFMQRAIELATENVHNGLGGPFGAVIVKNDRIIGEGANLVTATNDPTAHGEIIAIRNACQAIASFSLQACAIYTSCEPCPMCLAAIYWARIETIYFGNTHEDAARVGFDDSFLYQELKLDRHARSLPCHQLLREEAWQSFQAWHVHPGKIPY